MLTVPFRKAPFTTIFLVSEIFLFTAPLVMGAGPLGALWRILVVPAWVALAVNSVGGAPGLPLDRGGG